MSANDLIGVWRLLSYFDVDDTGKTREGPLGLAPRGLLIYGADGYMSVSMMRTDQDSLPCSASSKDVRAAPMNPQTTFMGYAGKWRLIGRRVIHEVKVSAHHHMVDTELVRDWSLDGDRLTIYGTSLIGEKPQRRVLNWQRA